MGECLDSEVLQSVCLLGVGDSLELEGRGGPRGRAGLEPAQLCQ